MQAGSRDRENQERRRGILVGCLMLIGMVAGYGLGLVHFFNFLVPLKRRKNMREMFVGTLKSIPVGSNVNVTAPQGQTINLVRLGNDPDNPEKGFKALSSTCPHLGCKVHWEAAKERFYCPCHQGVFDREGTALEGPPAKERQNLPTYQVKVNRKNGWVFVLVASPERYGV